MAFTQRPPTAGGLDPNTSPNLPIGDSSQAHDIPTGTGPSLAKLQDWIAWCRDNGVFYADTLTGTIAGDVTIDGNLTVNSAADVGTDLTVGDDLTVAGDSTVTGTLTVGASASVGTDLTVGDDADITGTLTVGASAGVGTDLTVGDDLTVAGDATVTGTLTAGGDIVLSPARAWTRHSLRICNVSYVDDDVADPAPTGNYEGPERPTAWVTNGGSANPLDPFYIRTLPTNTDTHDEQHYHWIALDGLPHGGTFIQVVVLCDGHNTPTTTAKFQIVRMSQIGTVDTMSSLTDKSGSWGVQTQTTVTVTSNSTISSDYTYAVVVYHPILTGSGSGSWIEIGDVEASGTVSAVPIG